MAWARVTIDDNFRRGGESGTAAIEFALMAPFLATLLLGVVEFGLAWSEAMQVNAVVDAGIMYAAANASTFTISAAQSALTSLAAASNPLPAVYTLTATPSSVACSGGSGTCVQVSASATVKAPNLFPTSFGIPNPITASAVIRIQ